MRILRSTPDEFVVQTTSWLLAGALLVFAAALTPLLFGAGGSPGPFALAVMAVMISSMVAVGLAALRSMTVTLTKSTGRIEFKTVALIGAGRRVHALQNFIEARAEALSDADGKSSRLVFVFSDAMAEEIDPGERARREALRKCGFSRARLTDSPLTFYYSSGDRAERMAAAINTWRGPPR